MPKKCQQLPNSIENKSTSSSAANLGLISTRENPNEHPQISAISGKWSVLIARSIRPGYRALQLVQNPIVADKNSPYVIVKTEINKKTNCSKQIN